MSAPARSAGSVMFSAAVRVGTRLNDWNTKPMWSRRRSVSPASSSWAISCSPTNVWPAVGTSSPAMQCIKVDFPEPDGPITAVNRPRSNVTSTPSSARTSASPWPYVLTRPTARAAAPSVPRSVSFISFPRSRVCAAAVTTYETLNCRRRSEKPGSRTLTRYSYPYRRSPPEVPAFDPQGRGGDEHDREAGEHARVDGPNAARQRVVSGVVVEEG